MEADTDAPTVHPAIESQGQATCGTANLRSKTTGLPFVVFILQKAGAWHDARVKVSDEPRVQPDQMGSYRSRPYLHTDGPRLSAKDEALLQAWIERNLDVPIRYWDGQIAFTEDAIDLIRPI